MGSWFLVGWLGSGELVLVGCGRAVWVFVVELLEGWGGLGSVMLGVWGEEGRVDSVGVSLGYLLVVMGWLVSIGDVGGDVGEFSVFFKIVFGLFSWWVACILEGGISVGGGVGGLEVLFISVSISSSSRMSLL